MISILHIIQLANKQGELTGSEVVRVARVLEEQLLGDAILVVLGQGLLVVLLLLRLVLGAQVLLLLVTVVVGAVAGEDIAVDWLLAGVDLELVLDLDLVVVVVCPVGFVFGSRSLKNLRTVHCL